MPRYAITRLWSVAGSLTTEVEAASEAEARSIEETRWSTGGATASLPPELRNRIDDLFEEVESVEEVAEVA